MASFLAFAAFASLAVLLPGVGVQRLLRTPVDSALVVPAGTAACALAFWLSLAMQAPLLFPAALAVPAIPALRWAFGSRERVAGPSLRGVLAPALALVALLAATQYRWNRVEPATGDFLLDPLVTSDSAFHVGLTHELLTGGPPQVPGVAGFPLGYHLGTDLVRAAALRWASVSPWDSLSRFDVTLWAVGLMLVVRTLTARLGGGALAVAIAPWTLLLTDFSFAYASNAQAHWWCDLLRGNLLLSLVYANPVVPALGLALGALVALSRFDETRLPGHLALAAFLAGATPLFKVFLGAQLLLALGTAFLLARSAPRVGLALVGLPAAVVTAFLALGQGAETVSVALAPLDLVRATRETLGLSPVTGAGLAAAAAVWVLLSLGLRFAGLGEAIRALRGTALASAAAVLALSGWPIGLLFRVSAPELLQNEKLINDAAYLVEQSGPVLWVFTALALARFATSASRRTVAVLAVLLLATPATLQYAVKKATTPPDRMPAPMVRAMAALARVSRPGDVVLQRPGGRYPPAPVVLAGRRVTYERFTPYLTQFAPKRDLEARHAEVYRFFRTESRDEALRIARELGASFLALYGNDRVRFDTTGVLEPVHEETGARVYRIKQ